MNPTEQQIADSIRRHLDAAAADVRSGVAYRLQQARAAALAQAAGRREQAAEPTLAMAGSGRSGEGGGGGRPLVLQPRTWLALAVLVAGMLGYQEWSAWQDLKELEDLDTAILSSDLPIDAYLDRGFQQWLKTSKPDE